ncbi:hypothetical protein NPIL_366231, partial [Nephila pilipes]
MERGDDAIIISPENNDQISIPALQKDIPELALMKIKRQDFIKAQKDHGDLKTIYEQVLSQTTALNKSYSLVDELLVKNREDKLEVVNAVQTRSQTEAKKKGNDSSKITVMERGDDAIIISPENNDQISIPALQKDIPELALMKIKRQDFIKAQKDHGDLKTIYEQVLSQTTALNKSYSLVDELLVKNREDKLGNIVKLL